MKLMTRARFGYLTSLVAGVALGVAVVGTAAAAPKAPATTKTVTHHYSLAASAFAPDGLHDASEDYFNGWDPSTLSNTNPSRCFNAGLSLPPSVTLKSVTFYYTAGSTVLYVELNRQNLKHHSYTELADTDTAAASSPAYSHVTLAIPSADATVNMGDYAYSAGVCPSGNTTFSGLTVTYTEPAS